MLRYYIPEGIKENSHFDELTYSIFCGEMGMLDAFRMSDEEWTEAFEKYDKEWKRGKVE